MKVISVPDLLEKCDADVMMTVAASFVGCLSAIVVALFLRTLAEAFSSRAYRRRGRRR